MTKLGGMPVNLRDGSLWILGAVCAAAFGAPLAADAAEGMWPYNMAPVEAVKSAYGFELTPAWLDRAMAASVRFSSGASGSFVSLDGLVMTNHHVGADCIQKLSQGERDYMKDGFFAEAAEDEIRCPDLELNRLRKIEDVTARVEAAAEPSETGAAKNKARKAEMARIEKACAEPSGFRCDVVTLYAGGAYHLYEYEKYTDVRLVFAPEFDAAFFGGDPENFTFPRTCLDVAFFRIYEEGRPVATPDYFPFSDKGVAEGSLVFVSGHPGSTGRFKTPAELEFLRDTAYPFILMRLGEMRTALAAYMAQGETQSRAARDDFFGVENGIKATTGYLRGLRDPALMAEVGRRHDEVRAKIADQPPSERAQMLEAWPKLEAAFGVYAEMYAAHSVTERGMGPAGTLVGLARHLLRLGDELDKPSHLRLREYRDSNLVSLELSLFSEAPIDDGVEVLEIAGGLEAMRRVLGTDDATVEAALAGQTPQARAHAIVAGTKLEDVAVRKALLAGGRDAIRGSGDPMIAFVMAYDETARMLRARYEDEVQSVERQYAGRIAEAWAKAYGHSVYPDATSTLRLNHGEVTGYQTDGQPVEWRTTFARMFAKHDEAAGAAPYPLPKRWLEARDAIDMNVPFNFVSTNDIIGGNSGSPVIDRNGHAVGLIFDGNIQQLPNRFLYRDIDQRSVSVHTAGIAHALERIYDAKRLVVELRRGRVAAERTNE